MNQATSIAIFGPNCCRVDMPIANKFKGVTGPGQVPFDFMLAVAIWF